jgi:Lon-like ATP-dependent protease
VTGEKKVVTINQTSLNEYVGKPVFNSDKYYDETPFGVVMGLAWTSMGGATLYVETVVEKQSQTPALKCTGQMGEVMKESTEIAYTYAKHFLEEISPGNKFFEQVNNLNLESQILENNF